MDSVPWLQISSAIHNFEEMRLPVPSFSKFMMATAIGVPVAVLVHDTSSFWMPVNRNIPVVSWFLRKWRSDTSEDSSKARHLRIFRNLVLFGALISLMYDSEPKDTPYRYVSDRVTSSNARRTMGQDILKGRKEAFAAANKIMNEDAYDPAKCDQQRDAALRRRHVQESKNAPVEF